MISDFASFHNESGVVEGGARPLVNALRYRFKRDRDNEYKRVWRKNNPEKVKAYSEISEARNRAKKSERSKAYYRKNKEKILAKGKAWRTKNEARFKQSIKLWRAANPQKVADMQERNYRAHPAKFREKCSRRRAREMAQVHPLVDFSNVASLHLLCAKISAETGVKHHVDHIIPLARGGWHHQDNLQVLPSSVNHMKGGDPLWEQSGYKSWRDVPKFLWPDALAEKYASLIGGGL